MFLGKDYQVSQAQPVEIGSHYVTQLGFKLCGSQHEPPLPGS